MDANSPSPLADCVTDEMSANQAADSTLLCWIEAEEALSAVLGPEGLGVVFRQGEEVAERNLMGVRAPPAARVSIGAFCEWMRSLTTKQALGACRAFLESVENYLASLVGMRRLRHLLGRSRPTPPVQRMPP